MATLSTSDFDYRLPEGRVARYPAERRADARLLVLERGTGRISHRRFRDLPALMHPGDLLVVNDTRVFPARLTGAKPTGAAGEVLLLAPAGNDDRLWEALVRPGNKLREGRVLEVAPPPGPRHDRQIPGPPEDRLQVRILSVRADGRRIVRLESELAPEEAIERFGRVPLPPYLSREAEPLDRERYQTVYAREEGSVAAPTAGLHFTGALLERIRERGVERAAVTLHVGVGTFRPVEAEDPGAHPMESERYAVSAEAAAAWRRCREGGGRVWAVGTTVVRTLETVAARLGGAGVGAGAGRTGLFIRPPFDFRAVDCLVTNFHLPRSTLLMLVSAFAGIEPVRAAYEEAITRGYRFYSYGDAMALVP